MGPPSKKRKLQPATGPSTKRPKNQSNAKANKNGAEPRKVVDASALAWEEFDEEFGGLQVIRNVGVVRDGDKVQFLVPTDDSNDNNKKSTSKDPTTKQTDDQDADNDSFEGFSDNDMESEALDPSEPTSRETGLASSEPQEEDDKSAKQQAKKNEKKKTKQQQQQQLETGAEKGKKGVQKPAKTKKGGAFDILEDVDGDADEQDEIQEPVDMRAWKGLNISSTLLDAIEKLGFPRPTKIQEKAVPLVIDGNDVIGKAQTGSGKTLAFGIPMVDRWLALKDAGRQRSGPLAVVLSPTRELAKQLGDHIKALCEGLESAPYIAVVTGGLSIQKQQRQLEKADIVIGTPGRLWEVLEGDKKLQDEFTKIRFLVVDEADRMFKAGQFKEVEDILGALDKKDPEADSDDEDDEEDEGDARQTLVFSATFDKDLQTKLAGKGKFRGSKEGTDGMEYLMKCLKFRREPKFVDISPKRQMADGLREGLIECGAMEKDLHLYTIMMLNPNRRTLVFTNSISAVRRLTPLLQNLNLNALPLHSQMAQKARLRSIERYTASRNTILIATDVAARGLDIKEVDQVIHYHVPRAADTYIHRSGRTARGDRTGASILLCAPDEVISTRRLAAKVHAKQDRSKDQMIQTLPLDRNVVVKLKPRVDLAKKLADAVLAKEKGHGDDEWLKNAAEELGVEYDAEEFQDNELGGKFGRGGGRKRKEKEARGLTKAEMSAIRHQLKAELSSRVNLGVSEKYITGGRVDVAKLLREREGSTVGGLFLGGDGLGLDL